MYITIDIWFLPGERTRTISIGGLLSSPHMLHKVWVGDPTGLVVEPFHLNADCFRFTSVAGHSMQRCSAVAFFTGRCIKAPPAGGRGGNPARAGPHLGGGQALCPYADCPADRSSSDLRLHFFGRFIQAPAGRHDLRNSLEQETSSHDHRDAVHANLRKDLRRGGRARCRTLDVCQRDVG